MNQVNADQLCDGNLKYRPDEEPPKNIIRKEIHNAEEFESDLYMGDSYMSLWKILVYGFLTSAVGAILAVLAGLVISISWPLWVWATAGSLVASVMGWLGVSRRDVLRLDRNTS